MAIASIPALIRTSLEGRRAAHTGRRLSVGDKVTAFLASIGVVAAIGFSGFIAFGLVCFPLGLAAYQTSAVFIFPAFVGGALAGLLAALFVGRKLW